MMDAGIADSIDTLIGGGTIFAADFFQVNTASRHNCAKTATDLAIEEHGFDLLFREKEKIKVKGSLLV
jgi:hypothetical protein